MKQAQHSLNRPKALSLSKKGCILKQSFQKKNSISFSQQLRYKFSPLLKGNELANKQLSSQISYEKYKFQRRGSSSRQKVRSNTEEKRKCQINKTSKMNQNGVSIKFVNSLINSFKNNIVQSKVIQKKSKLQDFCLTNRSYSKQSTEKSSSILQDQKRSLQKLTELRTAMNGQNGASMFVQSSSIRFKSPRKSNLLHSRKQSSLNKTFKIKPKQLNEYLEFISAGKDQTYSVGFDFTYLRRLDKKQVQENVDFQNYKILESILLCTNDILNKKDDNYLYKKKAHQNLLKEYSCLYFRLFEKSMMEVILLTQYFSMFQQKIFSFFLTNRIYFLYLYSFADDGVIFESDYLNVMGKICAIIHQTLKMIYQGYREMSSQQDYVFETFKILKVTKEVQRKYSLIDSLIKCLKVQEGSNLNIFLEQFKIFDKVNNFHSLEMECLTQLQMLIGWHYLKIPPIPYIPVSVSNKPYLLIISINRVLVYFNQETRVLKYRPYLDRFLKKVRNYYEIVAFSDETKIESDQLIDHIEKDQKYFSYRLYREHMSFKNGGLIKDTNKFGRDVDNMVIIDCDVRQLDKNGIFIKQFINNKQDNQLLKLSDKLQKLVLGNPAQLSSRMINNPSSLSHISQVLEQQTVSLTK